MANKQINSYTTASPILATSNLIGQNASNVTEKYLMSDLKTFVNDTAWGNIPGTLSAQTDLQSALDLKAVDTEVVKIAGTQTVTGDKTFSAAVTASTAPTAGDHLTNKTYVDAEIAASGGNTTLFLTPASSTIAQAGTAEIPYRRFPDAADNWASVVWSVPAGFTSIVSLKAMWASNATSGNMYAEFKSRLTSLGDSIFSGGTTDTIAPAAYATDATAGALEVTDITASVNGLSPTAGDILGIETLRLGTSGSDTLSNSVDFIGLEIVYN